MSKITEISREDVLRIATGINLKLTDDLVDQVLMMYDGKAEDMPDENWSFIVECILQDDLGLSNIAESKPYKNSRYTNKQIETINFLESLVHDRFSEEQLNKKLSDFFNENIEVYNKTADDIKNYEEKGDPLDDDVCTDYNLMFNSEKEETYGYFDIYILPMLRKGFNGADMYITEISFEFE